MLQRFATLVFLWLVAAGLAGPAPELLPAAVESAIHDVSAAELRRHVEVLASDEFAGRGVGHEGNHKAEAYIAAAFRDSDVVPAIPGYLQPVEIYEPRLGTDGRLTVSGPDGSPVAELATGSDFYPLVDSSDAPAAGPMILAGHGISAPEARHDDYAGLNARGAIVLVEEGAPKNFALSDDENHELGGIDRKVADARRHGAAGLIVLRGSLADVRAIWPERTSIRSAEYRLMSAMRATPLAVAAISEQAARPLREALQKHRPLHARLIPGIVAKPIVVDNVLGLIEGRQPGGEMVVVGAHLDHDGIDEAGRIYNGADDNASGTAAVIAMASAFARAASRGLRPARAVVFALWNGEEKGSLGAEYYVAAPVPARRVIANINLDMVGRREDIPDPQDGRYRGFARTSAADNANVVHLLGYSYSPDLAKVFGRANTGIRLAIREDYDRGAQGLLKRSDNWPFLEHGVPAVFLTTGLHPDYHTPDDDTGRLDFSKLERITELASRAAWITADGDAPGFKAK